MQNGYGIRLGLVSDSIVACNDIIGNGYGVHLGSSFGNIFYHNNFVESTISQASGGTLLNAWDNGVEGNYWSNYSGVDSNHDGIGDSWHEINQNNVDHYPLMGMFSNFNVTSEYSVQTVCNSTVSDFYFNGTAILFNVSGENDTCGFCRICIPTALINETYRIFVNGTQVLYDLLSDISNATYTYLYFTHNHSMQEVIVIPELSSLLNMLLFITTTLLLVVVFTKKFQLLAS
jgi:parallel beta-helix repeat protein